MSKLLAKGESKAKLTKAFHSQVNRIIEIPWLIALTEDFRFGSTSGKKPFGLTFLQWFVKKVVVAGFQNEKVYAQFMSVLHLKSHPVSLFKPAILAGVFRSNDCAAKDSSC
ncbi:hypothetical protein [Mesobacillus subterraneus]|uniref:Uncharacterized protein n=1 Tax=Mesobacillus subterraneus TaxID=285983 RepID=A0A3R9EXL4_9BACI|nr:hypothetical protein [Mesobacillus subterraneus]RSD25412.1 hypothetical protein EJA10_16515 [Mesobacillus subterraneus]